MGGAKGERLVKSKERVRAHGEVFTPAHIVKQMCDMLEENAPGAFLPEKTFLEPTCGTGNFLVEILNRKLDHCETPEDCLTALESIYAIDLLPDNVAESKARMLEIFVDCCGHETDARAILERNIVCGDSLEIMKRLENETWEEATI